ncbi:MAG: cell division protein ZapA [Treponema sp.]|jgi:cell division protein ZapA (FtsZ GTPase activity inhibitor)|nr:cell division protein ZapA [Treponema sp.]
MANELKFDILGTSFSITVDEDSAYLEKVLTQYQSAVKNTQKISGITDPLNIAILTGFLLCDEFNKVKQELDEQRTAMGTEQSEESWEEQEVEDRTLRLITKLEQALNIFSDDKDL